MDMYFKLRLIMEVGALIVVIPLSAFMLYIAFKKDKKRKEISHLKPTEN